VVPVGIYAHYQEWNSELVFALNFVGIIPMAWLIGKSTEDLALVTGDVIGGLLNATFGNVVEMLLCVAGIQQNQLSVTKCTLVGSILSNVLLVMGCSFLIGGCFYKTQNFCASGASVQVSLLVLGTMSLALPTMFYTLLGAEEERMLQDSRAVSCMLLAVYVAYLYFQIRTHPHIFQSEEADDDEVPDMYASTATVLLAVCTVITSVMTDFLVDSIEGTVESWQLSQEFIGIILLPIIGNAVEHYSAISVAAKNKMDLSLGVAAGSGCQMALFVTPFTVIAGWVMDKPMSLDFHPFQVIVMLASVLMANTTLQDGASNWLEGLMLVVAYIMVGAVYFVQLPSETHTLLAG